QVRPATRADRDLVVEIFVQGFVADPLLRFFFPDDLTYPGFATAFFGFLVDLNLDGGEILITANGEAAALWTPPEGPGLTGPQIAERWEAEMAPLLPHETLGRLDRFEAAAERIGPPAGHRYLGVLATHPDHRYRGYARAVLAPVLDRDDRDGIGVHLDTGTPDNLPFYARFGFRVHGETNIEEGPHVWSLVRDPGRGPPSTTP
ncbi:MAG: GNAT family N-acetyltransferase, partial [Actinomycetota bacterium]